MMNREFRSVAVTVTPFAEGIIPDFEEIAVQTEQLDNSSIDAIFPCASTGEYPKISRANKVEMLKTVAQINNKRKAIVAGCCGNSVDGVAKYIEVAKELEYDACVICPPYYFPQSQEDIFEFYEAASKIAEGFPVIAYHVPFFTTGIEMDTYKRILQLPGIVGIKDSSANMKRISHCCNIASIERPDFKVFSGTDDCLFPALCAGCKGSMTALGATHPDIIADIFEAFDNFDLKRGLELNNKILPLIREADSLTFPIGYKLLAKAMGTKIEEPMTERARAVYYNMVSMINRENLK